MTGRLPPTRLDARDNVLLCVGILRRAKSLTPGFGPQPPSA